MALITGVGDAYLTPGNLVRCAASQRLSYMEGGENHNSKMPVTPYESKLLIIHGMVVDLSQKCKPADYT